MDVIIFEKDSYYEHIRELTNFIKKEVIQPEWLNPEQAAEMLNIKPSSLKSYRDNGLIEFSELSERKFLYNRKSISNYIMRHAKKIY